MASIDQIRRILETVHTIAMVGLSARSDRPSYFAAKYLLGEGYRVIPVNPRYDEVLGQPCYPELAAIPEPIDVVDLFQRAETAPGYAETAVALGAKVLWLQLGVCSEPARRIATAAGLEFVEDRCMKIEHSRIVGRLRFFGINTGIISSAPQARGSGRRRES